MPMRCHRPRTDASDGRARSRSARSPAHCAGRLPATRGSERSRSGSSAGDRRRSGAVRHRQYHPARPAAVGATGDRPRMPRRVQRGVVDVRTSRRTMTFPSIADLPSTSAPRSLLVGAAASLGRDSRGRSDALERYRDRDRRRSRSASGCGSSSIEPYPRTIGPFHSVDRIWAVAIPLLDALALAIAIERRSRCASSTPSAVLVAVRPRPAAGRRRHAQRPGAPRLVRARWVSPAALSVAAPLVLAAAALDPTMALTHSPAR